MTFRIFVLNWAVINPSEMGCHSMRLLFVALIHKRPTSFLWYLPQYRNVSPSCVCISPKSSHLTSLRTRISSCLIRHHLFRLLFQPFNIHQSPNIPDLGCSIKSIIPAYTYSRSYDWKNVHTTFEYHIIRYLSISADHFPCPFYQLYNWFWKRQVKRLHTQRWS